MSPFDVHIAQPSALNADDCRALIAARFRLNFKRMRRVSCGRVIFKAEKVLFENKLHVTLSR